MALHTASDLGPFNNPRFVFLLIPLAIITVFCFGYVSLQNHNAAQASANPSQKHAVQSQPSEIPRQLLDEQQHLDPVPTATSDTSPVTQQSAGQDQANYGQAAASHSTGSSNEQNGGTPSASVHPKSAIPVSIQLIKNLL